MTGPKMIQQSTSQNKTSEKHSIELTTLKNECQYFPGKKDRISDFSSSFQSKGSVHKLRNKNRLSEISMVFYY